MEERKHIVNNMSVSELSSSPWIIYIKMGYNISAINLTFIDSLLVCPMMLKYIFAGEMVVENDH